jgi:hypothetical protein
MVKANKKRVAGEMYFNAGDLRFTVGKLIIKNGTFHNVKKAYHTPYPYFDGDHLEFEKINATV